MRFRPIEPPRVFRVGRGRVIDMKDCGRVELEPDEQVTFTTPAGGEYDVARKSWGFYATPSLNARLKSFALRAALARSCEDKWYVYLVEAGAEEDFASYLRDEKNEVVCWLDDPSHLATLARAFGKPERYDGGAAPREP